MIPAAKDAQSEKKKVNQIGNENSENESESFELPIPFPENSEEENLEVFYEYLPSKQIKINKIPSEFFENHDDCRNDVFKDTERHSELQGRNLCKLSLYCYYCQENVKSIKSQLKASKYSNCLQCIADLLICSVCCSLVITMYIAIVILLFVFLMIYYQSAQAAVVYFLL
ncbi:unnamed protein product [Moneuplotes crassus]|uniref:Uncharacterized protein n=1 Tax=Euplotes crassus TaxID=5936 RepID=A0AAD2D5P2_EUPCR|nr:unnamed protein product [Moneuplotes crassus]